MKKLPVSAVSRTFKRLSSLSDKKSQAYGPQQKIIKLIFDKLTSSSKSKLVISNGDEAWQFHLLMEILAKNVRTLNLYINNDIKAFESLIDSLEDSSVYNVLLANQLRRKK